MSPHQVQHFIYICPSCDKLTYLCPDAQIPGPREGNDVKHLPPEIEKSYNEARRCIGVEAYTAAALLCRKLLMTVAVNIGAAKAGKHFAEYVEFLVSKGYVPPNAHGWVDHIRNKANEATHQVPDVTKSDATDLVSFMEMILKLVYEYPNRVPKTTGS